MNRINLNQLYYFYVIAKEGSIKAACKKLHLTQPTLSGQLKNLEDFIGGKLFDRKYRKLEINRLGERVLKKAEKIFVLSDELVHSLDNKIYKKRNNLRIGAVSSLPHSMVHAFTIGLWNDDSMAADLQHGSLPHLISLLDSDKLDIIIADSPYSRSQKYQIFNLGQQNLVAVGTKKYASLKKNFPKSLDGQPLFAFRSSSRLQEDLDYFFKSNNISPEIIGNTDDDTFIKMVTKKNKCISILPEKSVLVDLKRKELIKIGLIKSVYSNCWAITSKMGSQRTIVRRIINNYMRKRGSTRL